MNLRVISAGHHLHTVRDGEALSDLGAALKQVCRERPRRVDRFIELALLGSGLCAAGRAVKPGCGLYLGSGFGPIGSNVTVQEQIFRDREPPRPFDFMNILGASAGFHVARNLGLTGPNLFISRRGASFEAAIAAAQADLQLGVVSQALLGVVEEVTLPLDQHRQRHGLPADTPLAEESHWLLLEQDAVAGTSLQWLRFKDQTGLDAYLQDHAAPTARVHHAKAREMPTVVTDFLAKGAKGTLLVVAPGSGKDLLHLGP